MRWWPPCETIGRWCAKPLHLKFAELPFHAVSILEDGCGRRLGAA
jgi:hypothetical protein